MGHVGIFIEVVFVQTICKQTRWLLNSMVPSICNPCYRPFLNNALALMHLGILFFFFLPRRPYWGKKSSSCSSIVDSTAHYKTLGSCVEHRRRCKSFFCYNVWCIPASQCWDRCVLRGQGQKCYNQTLLFLGWGGKDFTLFCEIVYDCPHWNGFYLLQKCKRLGKPSCIIKTACSCILSCSWLLTMLFLSFFFFLK